jgi:hypothetical protein
MSVSKILELYARCGQSLMGNGLCEAALPLSETSNALRLFELQRWRVLGGDIYMKTDSGELESIYENWFYEGSSSADSISAARDFIDSLMNRSVYVVFVLDDQG